jgi:hypothetical protein
LTNAHYTQHQDNSKHCETDFVHLITRLEINHILKRT